MDRHFRPDSSNTLGPSAASILATEHWNLIKLLQQAAARPRDNRKQRK
jgi:hypothetical protein